jgi:hypothetical protein
VVVGVLAGGVAGATRTSGSSCASAAGKPMTGVMPTSCGSTRATGAKNDRRGALAFALFEYHERYYSWPEFCKAAWKVPSS